MLRDRVTLVVPHRRRRDALGRLLAAVEGWRVLVVDDSDSGIDLDIPRVRLGGGSGFARACNAGLAFVTTPCAVLLNDDAVPLGDCLDRLSRQGGLCGPVLVGPGGVESTGIAVSSWGRVRQQVDVPAANRQVAALSGACLHLPSWARLDERLPHGFEDVELCLRLGGAWLVAGARCFHEGGGTLSRTAPEAQAHAVTGQMLCFDPAREPLVAALHAAQVLREGADWARLRAVARGWQAARRLRPPPSARARP
ncbi:MAG: glycosyltransferase family 2 protein [Deltaproteobacteria bacterium]|nr:glycosyltransferase family 2 protein [Deltaproteobacteria bacterium]